MKDRDLQTSIWQKLSVFLLVASMLLLAGCGQLISNAKQSFAEDLSNTILEFDDPETVGKAVPSYLILVSSMIRSDAENPDLLESGAKLYSAYASAFVQSQESKQHLSARAYFYASQSMCLRYASFCQAQTMAFNEYKQQLLEFSKADAVHLFVFSSTWAGVIEANSADWNRVAELPRVKAGIQRVLDLDETVENGNAHLYMAVLETILPPALGGKPELAKAHFERALSISKGRNLMAKVLYAERYARLLFDRTLHDKLLKEVLAVDVKEQDYAENRLINVLAQQKARALLASADDYF